MPLILVFDIEIDMDARRLVAGTFSRSIQSISIDSMLDITTGIKALEYETQYVVFPNPARGFLNIKSSSNSTNINWQIADLNGRIVKTGLGLNQPIDIQHLTSGSYIFIPEKGLKSKFLKVD
jgi:hypothetical protein